MQQTLSTIIVDDEPLARRGLGSCLEGMADVQLVAECSNGREALRRIAELSPDLVFLDVQMPGMSGFELVTNLQPDELPLLVFVTAHDEYAVEAFNLHAVDYLVKPVPADRLRTALDRARHHADLAGAVTDKQRLLELMISLTGRSEASVAQLLRQHLQEHRFSGVWTDKIAIKDGNEIKLLPVANINWIDAAGDYMCLHTRNRTHIMRSTMKELEQLLNPAQFQRVHRSTIVNLDRVTRICSHMNGEFHLLLADGTRLKLSRTYKEKVRHFF